MNARSFGLICALLAIPAVARADSPPPTQVPDNYAGLGARGLKGEPFAVVFNTKFKLMDLDGLTLSTRPALLVGGFDGEWRLPVTVEGGLNSHGFAWIGGVGLAHGMDDLGEIDAMVVGGIDLPFSDRWVLNVTINYMWQHAIDDLDGELRVTINYGF